MFGPHVYSILEVGSLHHVKHKNFLLAMMNKFKEIFAMLNEKPLLGFIIDKKRFYLNLLDSLDTKS
jgi:hypothetical protein